MLITGRKYYIGELCFIGDTGWTSFVKNGKQVNLYQFKKQPDANYVKDFSPKQIRSFHDNWINYANTILEQEEKVIMLTHYPMTCFANESKECWWSSETKLKEMKDCWKIFGHTHKSRQRRGNNISSQRGYSKNKNKEDLERLKIKQYTEQDFGMLIKTADSSKLQIIDVESLKNFYNPCLIENPNSQMELVKEVKKRGFNRASKSLKILGKLASDPYEYIRDIKLIMNDYEKSIHIGYRYMFDLSEKTIYAIHTAIASLERIFEKDDFSNPMIFVTSAIITGYVYNHIATQIDNMRPVDYYDIIRFYLVFQTMKKYELDFEDISVRKHCSRSITVKNMKIELPAINKKCMTVDEAYACFKGTSLLPENNMIE